MNGNPRQSLAGGAGGAPYMSRLSTVGLGSSRLSLGPPRMSLARGGAGGMAGGEGIGTGRMSDARMSGIGRTMGNVSRRSSQHVGRPSTAGAGSTFGAKDPRAKSDKQWQQSAIRNIINFLTNAGYAESAISPKSLASPTTKDFQSIFRFLYAQLDPTYVFQKKFEEEVPQLMRGLRYPFAEQLSKSHLIQPATIHAWPNMLAMLTWMVELICCGDTMDNENYLDLDIGVEVQPEKMFFKYVIEAYAIFLQGDDNFEYMDDELMENLDRKNDKVKKDIERLQNESDTLQNEWKLLTESEFPVVILERESQILEVDKQKFRQYIQHVEGKIQKFQDAILSLKEDLESRNKEADTLASQKAQLQHTVDSQEISAADVDRMTAERDQLHTNLKAVAIKMEDANKGLWEKEIEMQKKMDHLERLVQEYNSFAYKVGLLAADSPVPELAQELEPRVHATRPEDIVSLDLRNFVKPRLAKAEEIFKTRVHQTQDESIALQDTMDNLTWSCTQKQEELNELEAQVQTLTERYRQEQEQIGFANNASHEEIQQIERNIQRLKIEANGMLIQSQQAAQKAAIELDQIKKTCKDTMEHATEQISRVIVDVFNFHQHVQGQLDELEREAKVVYVEAGGVIQKQGSDGDIEESGSSSKAPSETDQVSFEG
ncbi:HEC/Ndc80p family-domain-containing protein [Phlyctochytrium arcticum]|nr:HEC/Ndc80p family-domain-containing protein [Phlyctochytrium arcticum]